jgi:hypothetical protein
MIGMKVGRTDVRAVKTAGSLGKNAIKRDLMRILRPYNFTIGISFPPEAHMGSCARDESKPNAFVIPFKHFDKRLLRNILPELLDKTMITKVFVFDNAKNLNGSAYAEYFRLDQLDILKLVAHKVPISEVKGWFTGNAKLVIE